MFKKIFSFFLLSFLFFSAQAMANSYTMPNILLDYINKQSPTVSGGYTSIKNYGTSTSDSLFSIDYYDENNTLKTLYFNVYNGNSIVTSFGSRTIDPTGNINSNFIGLFDSPISGNAQGGAIYNSSTIGSIIADFIGNYASITTTITTTNKAQGGAIYNNFSTINNITGDFIGNYASSVVNDAQGGAIYNNSTIGNITGDFIGNHATGSSSTGGAIYNNASTIGNIIGDFIGNYTTASNNASGGAIYNSSTIDNITSNFIGNYTSGKFALGGAIYNNASTIGNIIGDFIGNYTTGSLVADGGAIYNYRSTAKISFLADNRTSYFTDNYTLANGTKNYNAIYNSGTLTFNMQGTGSFVMNDSITGSNGEIEITGQNVNNNIFYLNDSISDNTVNVSNATMQFGSYIHNDGTITSGYSSDTTATINFNNNSILSLDLIDYTFVTGTNSFLSAANLNFDTSKAVLRNANIGTYTLGSGGDLTNIVTSASSLHKITNVSGNAFAVDFDSNSSLISNSQLGEFMSEINDNFSAQSTSSTNRFIFQASQVGTDTKKQAAIVDGGAQLSAVGASSALTRSAISAKQGTINTRISQELAYNVQNLIASTGDIAELITEKQVKDISLWLMPNYTHERISNMQSGSFSHGYTSHLFGLTLGADKTFTTDLTKFYTLGLAADGGMGFSNANQDFEHIENDFYYYGISAYGALANRNWIFSTNIGYEINNSEIHQLLENYNIDENLAANLETTAIYAKLKAEYQLEFEGYFYLAPLYKKLLKNKELEKIEALENLENLSLQELEKELEKTLLQLEKTLKNQLAQMDKEAETPRVYKYVHLVISPYVGFEFTSTNTGAYEVYSYDLSTSTDTTFNVESERQNVFTIPLGIQIKPELEEINGLKVSPQVKLGLAYSFGDLAEKSTSTAKGLTSIAYLETENIDALRGDLGLNINIEKTNKTSKSFMNNVDFDLNYDLQASKNRFNHSLFAKASYEF